MSSNGLLSFYDSDTESFKTIHVHHIENSYNHEIDSLHVLKDYYYEYEKVKSLFAKSFYISHFDKDKIKFSDFDFIVVENKSIDELIDYSNNEWKGYSHYVFYNNCWYYSPIDVHNIYYEKGEPNNHYEEYWDYDTKIHVYEYFMSMPNRKCFQNTKTSKVVIFYPLDKKPVVMCMTRQDMVSTSVGLQIDYIWQRLTQERPELKEASWYDFDPRPISFFIPFMLNLVEFCDEGSPSWDGNCSLESIAREHGIMSDTLESLLTKYYR